MGGVGDGSPGGLVAPTVEFGLGPCKSGVFGYNSSRPLSVVAVPCAGKSRTMPQIACRVECGPFEFGPVEYGPGEFRAHMCAP